MTELLRDVLATSIPCKDAGEAGIATVTIVPDGSVQSRKGTFTLTREGAERIIADFKKHGTDLPIDYEHQTIGGDFSAPDGKAPAAGWIKSLSYKAGVGLIAKVEWTDKGRAAIRAGEYKYLSPVVDIHKESRVALGLHSAALTNKPAIPRMERLAASDRIVNEGEKGDTEGMRLLRELRAALGLPEDSTPIDVLKAAVAALAKMDADADDDEEPAEMSAMSERELKAHRELRELRREKRELQRSGYIDRAVKARVLNPNNAEQVAFVGRVIETMGDDGFEQWLASAPHCIPQDGATNPPPNPYAGANDPNRAGVIREAMSEYRQNPGLAKLTTMSASVNCRLREQGLTPLSDTDRDLFAIGKD